MIALIESGHRVFVIGQADHTTIKLNELRVTTVDVTFGRNGFNFLRDAHYLLTLKKLIASEKPEIIHFFHAKPIIFGGFLRLVAKTKNLKMVATITGLGRAFEQSVLKRLVAGFCYKYLLRKYDSVIFQNRDDLKLFLDNQWVSKETAKLILGSGVDLSRFRLSQRTNKSKVAFVSRLINPKGVGDFIMLAERLSQRFPDYEFILGGEHDIDDTDAYPIENIRECESAGFLKYQSYIIDMPQLLEETVLFVFPSVYREGVPRVCLEAVACGVPVVAYEVPGTREIVVNNVSGITVEKSNYEQLEGAVCQLLNDEAKRNSLALSGRAFVEKEFDLNSVTREYLETYKIDLN